MWSCVKQQGVARRGNPRGRSSAQPVASLLGSNPRLTWLACTLKRTLHGCAAALLMLKDCVACRAQELLGLHMLGEPLGTKPTNSMGTNGCCAPVSCVPADCGGGHCVDVNDPQGSRGHSESSVALSDVEDRPGSDSDFAVGSERADGDLPGDAENSAADSPGSNFGSSHGCAAAGHALDLAWLAPPVLACYIDILIFLGF